MDKIARRERRKRSIRKKVCGTPLRPRVCIHKSNKNIFIQIIDDTQNKTIYSISTMSSELKDKLKGFTRKNINFAVLLGEEMAKHAIEKGIKKVVLDRSGYLYHGVIKAFSEAARKGGLEF